MKETLNYKLKKPDGNDNVNIQDLNYNADIIDLQIKSNSDLIATKETPEGSQAKATAALNSAKTYTDGKITETRGFIGSIADLATTIKTNLVAAINEIFNDLKAHKENSTHIPIGLISMWSGLISAIPSGWALCNGQNGTPNLTDRFIMGAVTDATVNKTGGENAVALTEAQMPTHGHTGSTNSAGAHTHSYTGYTGNTGNGSALLNKFAYPPLDTQSGLINSAGAHTHTVSIGNTGGGQAHENRPAYYTLAFIMKV